MNETPKLVELPAIQEDPGYARPPADRYGYVPDVAAELLGAEGA